MYFVFDSYFDADLYISLSYSFKKSYWVIISFQNHNGLIAITSHHQLRLSGVWNTKLLV